MSAESKALAVKNIAIGVAVLGATAGVVYVGYQVFSLGKSVGDAVRATTKAVTDTVAAVGESGRGFNQALVDPPPLEGAQFQGGAPVLDSLKNIFGFGITGIAGRPVGGTPHPPPVDFT